MIDLSSNGDVPTNRQWAGAPLHVRRFQSKTNKDAAIFRLRKTLTVQGRKHRQELWLNLYQLRQMAKDHCF